MSGILATPVILSHLLIAQVLQEGDLAVDATAGNGHDTLFLARKVGPRGKVYAFDIQEEAILKTRERLRQAGLEDRVVLLQKGHERLREYVPERIKAAMFNLGYLPGGDHKIVTRPSTTLAALEQVLEILEEGGLVSIVVYRGHEGGTEEGKELCSFVANLDHKKWDVVKIEHPNRSLESPFLIGIQKKVAGGS
ncbi:MAG: Putative rRNA methylase [Thermoanaerobacterales bacterium 50_218]|nr:MAG: Putative rRNA methylase [Thermoanaerobacterales bacterium 50_218]